MSISKQFQQGHSGQTGGERRLIFSEITEITPVDDIIYVARRAHEESRFSYITFAPDKVSEIVNRVLSDQKRHGAMMAWLDKRPVGFTYCSVGEYHVGTGTMVTTIHAISVLTDVRRTLRGGRVSLGLFRGVETWSQARSSKEVLFHVTSDVDLGRTHKLIKRLGYRFIGGSYAKSLV